MIEYLAESSRCPDKLRMLQAGRRICDNPAMREDPGDSVLDRLRRICLALPEATERPSHGEPTWFVGGKKTFANLDDHHHGTAHLSVWCAAPEGAQETLIALAPKIYFRPPYVGHRGWIGIVLDGKIDWDEVAERIEESYRCVAPKRLIAALDARESGRGKR